MNKTTAYELLSTSPADKMISMRLNEAAITSLREWAIWLNGRGYIPAPDVSALVRTAVAEFIDGLPLDQETD